ncbi:MAG: hypothetical protein ABF290_10275 [Thiogranum sp.]
MIFRAKQSAVSAGQWGRKALSLGIVLALAIGMGMQTALADRKGHGDGHENDDFETFTPFNRVARLPVVRDKYGAVDHPATYAKAKAAALYLAEFVARYKDAEVLGEDVILGTDWVLGGTSKTCRSTQTCSDEEISHAILGIPAPEPIDPNDPAYVEDGTITPANTKKANVLDFCNEHYAKQALGVAPIVDDKTVVNGYSHTPALPCEVSIWNDDRHIYVDMLDPNAIFTLFFTDVLFSKDMKDPAFAEVLSALPPQVKSEIRAIILHAMAEFDPRMRAMDKQLGPEYESMEQVVAAVEASPQESPYKHMSYTRVDGGEFTDADSKNVTQAIIDTMSIHGEEDQGTHPTVIDSDGNTLDSILTPKSSWRSARATPLTLPGLNHVIEACSPKFAKMAMSTGLYHVTALPCEITVQILDQDGMDGKETLVVSYLDPHFMLGALFADISEEEQQAFADIPGSIMADLQAIVWAALTINSGIDLNDPVQISYDMLPQHGFGHDNDHDNDHDDDHDHDDDDDDDDDDDHDDD